MGAFFKQLALGLVAIPVMVIGQAVIVAFFQTAFKDATALWEYAVGFVIALVLSTGAAALIAAMAAYVIAPAAAGWMGIFAGETPEDFASKSNGARGAAHLALVAITVPLGILLFRYGVQEDYFSRAIMGLFLAGGGALIGLGGAVPSFYFARARRRRAKASALKADGVILFVTAALVGVALSMAVVVDQARNVGPRAMRAGRWYSGCIKDAALGKTESDCPGVATFTIATAPADAYLQLEFKDCRVSLHDAAGMELKSFGWPELRRLRVKRYDPKTQTNLLLYDLARQLPKAPAAAQDSAKPKPALQVRVSPVDDKRWRFYRVRLSTRPKAPSAAAPGGRR